MAAEIKPESVVVLQVDAALLDATEYAPDDLPEEIVVKGRGGTDFRPGFEWLDAHGIQPAVCLHFTDMECSNYPEAEPGYPVAWVNWGPPPEDWNREPWGRAHRHRSRPAHPAMTRAMPGAPAEALRQALETVA